MSLVIAVRLKQSFVVISDTNSVVLKPEGIEHINIPKKIFQINKSTLGIGFVGVQSQVMKIMSQVQIHYLNDQNENDFSNYLSQSIKYANEDFEKTNEYSYITSLNFSAETGAVLCGYNQGNAIFKLIYPNGNQKIVKNIAIIGLYSNEAKKNISLESIKSDLNPLEVLNYLDNLILKLVENKSNHPNEKVLISKIKFTYL